MEEEQDRISDLPGHVMDQILSYLHIDEEVRTSILSSKWRYKWATVPVLKSDSNCEEDTVGSFWEVYCLLYPLGQIKFLAVKNILGMRSEMAFIAFLLNNSPGLRGFQWRQLSWRKKERRCYLSCSSFLEPLLTFCSRLSIGFGNLTISSMPKNRPKWHESTVVFHSSLGA
ncbi:hypothetical protein CRG98_022017 [Punica granatum]|uniref:F-box domain-containing protein n=1 Tax=Punica granatum TaxID=22663 RepID=A0A2I0JPY5_PUNGR|nr:hypothetical protein CRG98_022017 [Punica granatum]